MKIRLEKIVPTPSGLVCGVLVHGPKDSWLRFALLEIPFDSLGDECLQAYWDWQSREPRDLAEDTPLAFDWG